MPSVLRKFFQYHESGGYQASITVEWCPPADRVDAFEGTAREEAAEQLASEIIAREGPKARTLVQLMRGASDTRDSLGVEVERSEVGFSSTKAKVPA